jgi:hypothetical protein
MRFDPWKVAEMINKIFVNLPVKDLDKSMARARQPSLMPQISQDEEPR